MKGQLISNYKVTRLISRVWVNRLIQMPTTVRYYGRLRKSEGTFIEVELE
jgi:hypothetical protein